MGQIKFSNHNLTHKCVFGEQYIEVDCIATIETESYKISYHRSPITGNVMSVKCNQSERTNENTLLCDVVEDMCFDELQD